MEKKYPSLIFLRLVFTHFYEKVYFTIFLNYILLSKLSYIYLSVIDSLKKVYFYLYTKISQLKDIFPSPSVKFEERKWC